MLIGERHENAALFQFTEVFQDVMDVPGEAVKVQANDCVDLAFVYRVHQIHEAWSLVGLSTLVIAEYPGDPPARLVFCDILTTQLFLCGKGGTIGCAGYLLHPPVFWGF